MGESPSADQIEGLSPVIDAYAESRGVDSGQLRDSLHKMLPATARRPQYQIDPASGAVSDGTSKVYGEQRVLRLTHRQLRRVIREAVRNHIDGHPFPGSLEDLAKCHGRTWGHGSVVDPSSWKENIKLGGLYTTGKAPTPLKGARRGLTESDN